MSLMDTDSCCHLVLLHRDSSRRSFCQRDCFAATVNPDTMSAYRMNPIGKTYDVGRGIDSLAAAAFVSRDVGMPGENITIAETCPKLGGGLDGAGNALGENIDGGSVTECMSYPILWRRSQVQKNGLREQPILRSIQMQSVKETRQFQVVTCNRIGEKLLRLREVRLFLMETLPNRFSK